MRNKEHRHFGFRGHRLQERELVGTHSLDSVARLPFTLSMASVVHRRKTVALIAEHLSEKGVPRSIVVLAVQVDDLSLVPKPIASLHLNREQPLLVWCLVEVSH